MSGSRPCGAVKQYLQMPSGECAGPQCSETAALRLIAAECLSTLRKWSFALSSLANLEARTPSPAILRWIEQYLPVWVATKRGSML